jgi:dual-specificity kinase
MYFSKESKQTNMTAVAAKTPIIVDVPQRNNHGDFHVVLGFDVDSAEIKSGKYKMITFLGEGTFGKVVEAYDRETRDRLAIKIVSNLEIYSRDARIEYMFLQRLLAIDPDDEYHFVRVKSLFVNHMNHVCIILPLYGESLYKERKRRGFTHDEIKNISKQLLEGIAKLHSHGLIHTDIRAENIVFEGKDRGGPIRIIDFGTCIDVRNCDTTFIVTSQPYRAPEVDRVTVWDEKVDCFSIGCLLCEIVLGSAIFDRYSYDADKEEKYLSYLGDGHFSHLVRSLLLRNPKERFSASQALSHPYFAETVLPQVLVTELHQRGTRQCERCTGYFSIREG